MSKAYSPFAGSISYGFRAYPGHNGTDIRPAKRYTFGNEVQAMLPGKIVDICRSQKNMQKTRGIGKNLDYGILTGNGFVIENADTEYQIYNHVLPDSKWKIGDTVRAGDRLGVNDNSGNQTGAHLHMEYRRYTKSAGCYMPYDANYLFRLYNLKVGAPLGTTGTKNGSTPAAAKPKPPVGKKYISVQLGSRNSTVGKVQDALRKQGYTKQVSDNYFGKDQTEFNVIDFQKRTGLHPDGVAGEKTQKKLGL